MRRRFAKLTQMAAGGMIFKRSPTRQAGAGPGMRPGFGLDV
jgi:hypothetical protein